MNSTQLRLEAGGLVSAKTKLDSDATERIAARSYSHPALGNRPVVRLVSERLGSAEDLAMEFLGFQAPRVSKAIAVQHRRSLGFAAWALIHDPQHAQYALDLVKRMKAAARLAKSKPGHAWDVFTEMATELGRSAPHFLPVFWEDAGRTYKDLGNQNYGGRALNKSLQAERVHALESDRPRRRDVVLEFALAGCLAGKALTEYTNDLASQYSPDEAFQIFRDLCNRRTRGGMAPWSTLAKDFTKMAKAANLNADAELELWLEEVMESPAMGRAPMAFWNSCQKRIQRLVDRNPAFAVGLLRLTNFVTGYESWLAFLQECAVFSYLWRDQHNGSPALGQPIADWFSPVINAYVPTTALTLSEHRH